MNWRRRILIVGMLIVVGVGLLLEDATHVGRGWLWNEPFYEGRPASFWAAEIERWETRNESWETQSYERRSPWPDWIAHRLPETPWPALFDGDPDGLPVLQALTKHPSADVRDWARIGIERIDNDERGPCKIKHPSVIVTAQLYDVDESFHRELAKSRWHSQAELDDLERQYLNVGELPVAVPSWFDQLDKRKPLAGPRKSTIESNKVVELVSLTRETTRLASPAQRRRGQQAPQKFDEGVVLSARAQVSSDRRHVRLTVTEKTLEVEGTDRIPVMVEAEKATVLAEDVSVKESTFSVMRNVPDGGSLLLALHHRDAGRWLVVRIQARIFIEAEERETRKLLAP